MKELEKYTLLFEGKLPDYLADVNEQAENFLTRR